MIQGTLYIISAPSGAGKSSLIQALLKAEKFCNLKVSISHTTRAIRSNEKNGKDYFFISLKQFKHMIAEDAFLEYAQIFGNYYGTARKTIEQLLSTGTDIFLDIDWQGAQQIRNKVPNTRSVFILPPSKEELRRRLYRRGQDTEGEIAQRIKQAIVEIAHFTEYDYLIVNDDFNSAFFDLKTIILAERLRLDLQKLSYGALIKSLLVN